MNTSHDSDAVDITSPFFELVPDCRKNVLRYLYCTVLTSGRSMGRKYQMDESEEEYFSKPFLKRFTFLNERGVMYIGSLSELKLVMRYFTCDATIKTFLESDIQWFTNFRSLNLAHMPLKTSPKCYKLKIPDPLKNRFFSRFRNLRELRIMDCFGGFTDEMFRDLESLEVLDIRGIPRSQQLTDNAFAHLRHLRQLIIRNSSTITDYAFEKLCNAGSRLDMLHIEECPQITGSAFNFLKCCTLRELMIDKCPRMNCDKLKYLKGVETLNIYGMNRLNCHEAFKCLDDSVKHLSISHCNTFCFDEEAMRHLKGISDMECSDSYIEGLTDSAFSHLTGSIERLELIRCTGLQNLSKDMLWHLSGIEYIELNRCGIRIQEEDLPRLKKVFEKVNWCGVTLDFADESTMEKLEAFFSEKGASFWPPSEDNLEGM